MKKLIPLMTVFILLLSACSGRSPSVPATHNAVKQTDLPSTPTIEIVSPTPSAGQILEIEAPTEITFSPATDDPAVHEPPPAVQDTDVIEIKEKMFIAQTNDIYINPEDYLGKTLKYEGIFELSTLEETSQTYHYVIRYGPGCCGFDANAGFEVSWDGAWPEQNDWVEVVGVLEEYEEEGWRYLRLALSSIEVLDVRGAEYVDQ